MTTLSPHADSRGFTLTELAIVLLIFGLLIGGLVTVLSAQMSAREISDTRRLLENTREALLGFAIKNGRLPCPAAPNTTGVESFVLPGVPGSMNLSCTNNYNGFVPAITLGLSPTDAQGYLLDSWGNRVRYAVSAYVPGVFDSAACWPASPTVPAWDRCPLFTTANALVSYGLPRVGPFTDVRVCDQASCAGTAFFTPAVVFSPGKTFAIRGASGADEQANIDSGTPDGTFVGHEPRESGAPGGEFDDIVLWISPNILYSRLIASGAL